MIYAVIDTNVFVAALLSRHPDSATVQVVNALLRNGICPLYNKEITELRGALMEAKESLEGKRKLNTLVNLINELKALETKAKMTK